MSTRSCGSAAKTSSRPPPVLIISGYTCIGKTTFCNNPGKFSGGGGETETGTGTETDGTDLPRVIDMDSSAYDRDGFPENYLAGIRAKADEGREPRILLIGTFRDVATKLKGEGYYVAQVYPAQDAKTKCEWLRRLEERESGGCESRLYKIVDQNWDAWYDEMYTRDVSASRIVNSSEFLSGVIEDIYRDFRASLSSAEDLA